MDRPRTILSLILLLVALVAVACAERSNENRPPLQPPPPATVLATSAPRTASAPADVAKPVKPALPSCEQAIADYLDEVSGGAVDGSPADSDPDAGPSAGQYGAVMNNGRYFAHCAVPDDSSIRICAAIRFGAAVGVTVHAEPPSPELEECVAAAVRRLSFPSWPKLDVTRTTF